MLKWRFLGVITTLPSRASHPMAQSKMGALPRLLELRKRKLAVGVESVPNGTRHLAYVFLNSKAHPYYVNSLEPDDCHWGRERKESGLSPLRFFCLCASRRRDRSCETADFAWV